MPEELSIATVVPESLSAGETQGWLERLAQSAVEPGDDEDLRLRKSLLVFANALMNAAAMVWLAIYWGMGMRLPTEIPLTYQVLSTLILVIYLRTRSFDFFRVAQLALFLFSPFVIQWSIGSFVNSSGIVLLALLAPVGAMVVYGPRDSIPWFVAYVVLTAVSGLFDFFLASGNVSGVPLRIVAVFFVLNFTILSTIVYLLLRYFVIQKDKFQVELARQHLLTQQEKRRSEELLYNVLPSHVAHRLTHGSSTIADGFPEVTVMFADLVNFTELAERLHPREVVSLLNDLFTEFDALAERHGLDKIKTIGDAYMVAGGLGAAKGSAVDAVARMALEVHEVPARTAQRHEMPVQFRVGIATGPVIAGVIGARRFVYDLWGDTVNVASRITGEAPAGGILLDRNTSLRLGAGFALGPAHELHLKGKGMTAVYRLLGRAAAAA